MYSTTTKNSHQNSDLRIVKRISHQEFLKLKPQKKISQVESLSNWFETLEFNHFCTFTTRKPITSKACRRIAHKVEKYIEHKIDPTFAFFWASEPFELNQGETQSKMSVNENPINKTTRYHFHALLRIHDYFGQDIRQDLWKWYTKTYGRCEIDPIRKGADFKKAASIYCSKYTMKKNGDFDICFGHLSHEKRVKH
jgi:hypothetical protein